MTMKTKSLNLTREVTVSPHLDYPSILKDHIASGRMTYGEAVVWLHSHGIPYMKAKELLR